MKKIITPFIIVLILLLSACGNGEKEEVTEGTDELVALEVEFNVPETAEPGETVELEAIVSYGDELVEDADEVNFEYWLKGDEDDSSEIDGIHTEDGRYTAEVTFPEDGTYEIYAHTTARGLHTMPLKSIIVGDGGEAAGESGHHAHHEHNAHTDGFHLHFMEPDTVQTNEVIDLTVHLQLEDKAMEDAIVRYEIAPEGDDENTAWVDAEETVAGEYIAAHEFTEPGTYKLVIHVEDDADLHEHDEYMIEVE
ncbi:MULTISPECIES: FixH family protein [Oceanobacillus]|uniref:YtkA-like domain-containing protein n=1 Tax=Oceanobacillus indicireducens TaxID=1004261 RepID=A0A917XQN9_9BACI|nr:MULTISPECIES: FixH family protein [Oceanobacillus]GGN48728.1 hypothetical protein GCM10007971_00660 [Oceanobacillus indicireducens]